MDEKNKEHDYSQGFQTRVEQKKMQYLVLNQQIQRSTEAISRLIPRISRNESVSDGGIGMKDENVAFFRLLFAAASIIFRPVIVDPVKATLSTSTWAANAAPPMGP